MFRNTKERQPWPMKWVVLAIVLFIIPYTYLNIKYRKPGKAFEPYHDMKDQANTLRLLEAGFQRVNAQMERPVAAMRYGLTVPTQAQPGGIAGGLKETLISPPILPASVGAVQTPGIVNASMPYSLEFSCTLSDDKKAPLDAAVYARAGELVILPNFEKISDGLEARGTQSLIRITVPANSLKPGTYKVVLCGEKESRSWSLQVN